MSKGVYLWDATSLVEVNALSGFDAYAVQFSPDDSYLACTTSNNEIFVWDLGGVSSFSLKADHANVNRIAFRPDGVILAATYTNGNVRLWDTETKQASTFKAHNPEMPCAFSYGALSAAFSPDGKLLATGGCDDVVRFWNPFIGTQYSFDFKAKAPGGIYNLAFTPDSLFLVLGAEHTIEVWDMQARKRRAILSEDAPGSHPIAVSPSGSMIAGVVSESYGQPDARIVLWDMDNAIYDRANRRTELASENLHPITDLKFSHDDQFLFSAHGNEIRCWKADPH